MLSTQKNKNDVEKKCTKRNLYSHRIEENSKTEATNRCCSRFSSAKERKITKNEEIKIL